jgi:hypothetical protein
MAVAAFGEMVEETVTGQTRPKRSTKSQITSAWCLRVLRGRGAHCWLSNARLLSNDSTANAELRIHDVLRI